MGASVSWERRRTCEWRYWAVSKHLVRDASFVLYFFQKGRREVEKNALVWLGSIYYRSVHLSTVHQDYIPGDQWVRASFYYIGHISGKKDHDLEESWWWKL